MKKIIIVSIFYFCCGTIFSQSQEWIDHIIESNILLHKAEYFLSNDKKLDKLDEKVSIKINKELKNIETNFKKGLKISYIIKNVQEEVSESRIIRYEFPNNRAEDLYLTALLSMRNPTQYEADYLKQQFQVPVYKTVIISPRKVTIENKVISFNKNIFSTRPKWDDVVNIYGGYAKLLDNNIDKADWQNGKFDIKATLTAIELINETECLAIVDISDELKLNKVPKSNYKYKGNYEVEDFGIYDIYRKSPLNVVFTFKDKKYMGASNKFTEPINSFVDGYTVLLNKYSSSIDFMFDDLVTHEVFKNIDDVKKIINDYVEEGEEKYRIAMTADQNLNDWTTTIDEYETLVTQFPTSDNAITILLRMGEIQAGKLKQREEAINTYNRIASEYPESTAEATEALQRAGKLYENAKEYEEAIHQYMAIHENYPGTDGALKSLKECATIYEKKMKQKDKAVEMLNTLIKEFPESKDAKRAKKRIKKLNK